MACDVVEEISQRCILTRTRLVARAVTALYDEALRPFGIQASQFSLLVIVAKVGPERRAEIGRLNRQDRSTLTRNLKVMLRQGWIEEVPDRNGRGRLVAVAAAGLGILEAAAPAWREAQHRAVALLGPGQTTTIARLGDRLLFGDAA